MKKQFAVLGLGRFGKGVALTLQKLGCDVIAVDNDMECVKEVADEVTYAMQADIEDPAVVRSLGVQNLDGVIIAISDEMEASILATLVAKESEIPFVLAKARDTIHAEILRRIGADQIVFPEHEMGIRVARKLVSANFKDRIALSENYSIIETTVPEPWIGKTAEEIAPLRRHEISIIAEKTAHAFQIAPDLSRPLAADTTLLILGEDSALARV